MIFEIGRHVLRVDVDYYQIECILLFGSYVHGEADEKSDIDLVIILDDAYQGVSHMKRRLAKALGVPPSWIMVYTKSVFRKRASRGSLFFQGLKASAQILYQRSLYIQDVFRHIPKCVDNTKELLISKERMTRALKGYEKGKISLEQLLKVVAFQIRNLCIQICYQHGRLEMRKYEPIRLCLKYKELQMPFTLRSYKRLYEMKRDYTQHLGHLEWSKEKEAYVYRWINRYMNVLQQALAMTEYRDL